MTKIVPPDETLNIYYRVSEDTNELEDIVKIEKNGEEENISDLPDLQNTKIIQWSPDSEHEDEEFEFEINGFGTQKIKVIKIPNSVVSYYDAQESTANTGEISKIESLTNETFYLSVSRGSPKLISNGINGKYTYRL